MSRVRYLVEEAAIGSAGSYYDRRSARAAAQARARVEEDFKAWVERWQEAEGENR